MKFEKIKYYKRKTVDAAEEAFVDNQSGSKSKSELLRRLRKEKTKRGKLVAAFSLIREFLPEETAKLVGNKLNNKDFSQLPFDPDKFEIGRRSVGRGAFNCTYLLQAKNADFPSFALKINHCNRGSLDELREVIKQEEEECEKLKKRYRDLPEFIPVEHHVVIKGGQDEDPAIMTLQEFFGRNLKDVFCEIDRKQLDELMRGYPRFKEEFLKFAEITVQAHEETGEMLDTIGKRNVSVAEDENGPKLVCVDPHSIKSPASEKKKVREMLEDHLNYLKEVSVEENSSFGLSKAA